MLYYFPSSSRSYFERGNRPVRPILDLLSKRHRPQATAQTQIDVHVHYSMTCVRAGMSETRNIDTCEQRQNSKLMLEAEGDVRKEDFTDQTGILAFGVRLDPKPPKSVLRKQSSFVSSSQSSSRTLKSVTWAMPDQMYSYTLDTIDTMDSFKIALTLSNSQPQGEGKGTDSESSAPEVSTHRNDYDQRLFFL
jgi:hypothetical protein